MRWQFYFNLVFHITNMKNYIIFFCIAAGVSGKLQFGKIAEHNHNNPKAACDPDYGWLPGVDGTGKCYMLIRTNDYDTCTTGGVGWGMSWFDGMECCHYNGGYLAEPISPEEQALLQTYIVASSGPDKANTWWIGLTDLHHEGTWIWMSNQKVGYTNWQEGEPNQNGNEDCAALNNDQGLAWMDLLCDQENHMGYAHFTICEKIPEA